MPNPFRVKGALAAPAEQVNAGGPLDTHTQRPVSEGSDHERLSLSVQGQPATDIEERLARSAAKHPAVRNYIFNPRLVGGQVLPPDLRLSYAIYAPMLYAVQVDPQYPNNTGEARAQARVNDDLLFEHLKSIGAGSNPVTRLSRLELDTQTGADRALAGVV